MKKIILFNAQSGAVFGTFDAAGFSLDGINKNVVLYREVEMADDEYWYGDYENGGIRSGKETQVVSQRTLRDNAIRKIFSKYFYLDQIKIINDQLKSTIPAENQTQAFKDMIAFIDEARAEYHLQKEAYSSNPEMYIWVSDEMEQEQFQKSLGGFF